MTKIFISHITVFLPEGAILVDVDIIHPELLKVMCAEHTPIEWKTLQEVYVKDNYVFAPIPDKSGEYYRVQATWM